MPDAFPILIAASTEEKGKRLDQFLATRMENVSRARVQELISQGMVLVDGTEAKASLKLRGGEQIKILGAAERAPLRAIPEDIALAVSLVASPRSGFINGSNYRVDGGSVASL